MNLMENAASGVRIERPRKVLTHPVGPNRNGSYEDRVMAPKALPSLELVRQLIRYEPETGNLYWLPRPESMFDAPRDAIAFNGRFAGREAFTAIGSHGYKNGRVLGCTLLAHRLIWALETGHWPKDQIDHVNGIRTDNRIENLREASNSQNSMNQGVRADNTSGHKGVCWHSGAKKWRAYINLNGKRTHLGFFSCARMAGAAYAKANKTMHRDYGRCQ